MTADTMQRMQKETQVTPAGTQDGLGRPGRLLFCINVYADPENLAGCIGSIRAWATGPQEIIVADGRYEQFGALPEAPGITARVAEGLGCQVISRPVWPSEREKRNAYLVGRPGDWYFTIDADERLEGSISAELLEAGGQEAYQVTLDRDDSMGRYPVFRIFKHQDGIRYEGTHHAVFIGDRMLNNEEKMPVFPVTLKHLIKQRADQMERQRARAEYYFWLADHELGFRSGRKF